MKEHGEIRVGWGREGQEVRPSGNWGRDYVRPVDEGKEGGGGVGGDVRQDAVGANLHAHSFCSWRTI